MTHRSVRHRTSLRTLLLTLILVGGFWTASAPHVAADQPQVAWYDDLEDGWAASKRSGRPMLIYITSHHCHYCTQMKQQTLDNADIAGRVSAGFIAIQLNPQDHGQILARVRLKMYPTTLVALPRGKVVDHRIGFQSSIQLSQLLDQVSARPALFSAR